MELTVAAQRVMEALGDRFAAAGFPDPWLWPITVDELDGTFEELARLGLLAQGGGAGSRCYVTDAGG